jgi:hypothetical protein
MRFLPILILLCAIISKLDLKKYIVLLICTITFASLIIAPRGYLARSIDTPSDYAGKYVCKSNVNNRIKNVYVENIVSFGFFYYNCPGDYNLKFFENEKFTLERNSIYIKKFSDDKKKYFLNLQKKALLFNSENVDAFDVTFTFSAKTIFLSQIPLFIMQIFFLFLNFFFK